MKIRFFRFVAYVAAKSARVLAFFAGSCALIAEYALSKTRAPTEPVTIQQYLEQAASEQWKRSCIGTADQLIRFGYTSDEIVSMVQIGWHPPEYRGLAEAEAAFKAVVVQREHEIAEADKKKRGG